MSQVLCGSQPSKHAGARGKERERRGVGVDHVIEPRRSPRGFFSHKHTADT